MPTNGLLLAAAAHRRAPGWAIAALLLAGQVAAPHPAAASEAPAFASPPLAYVAVQPEGAAGAAMTPSVWTARGLDAFGDKAIFGAYLAGAARTVAVVGGVANRRARLGLDGGRELVVLLGGEATLPASSLAASSLAKPGSGQRTVHAGDILVIQAGRVPIAIGPHGMLAMTVGLAATTPIVSPSAPPAPDHPRAWTAAPDLLASLGASGLREFPHYVMTTGADGTSHVSPADWTVHGDGPLLTFFSAPARYVNLVSAKPGYRTPPHNVGASDELDVVLRGSSTGLYAGGKTHPFHAGDMVLIEDKGSTGRAVRIGTDGYLALSVNLTR